MSRLLRFGILLLLVAGITIAVIYRDQLDTASLETLIRESGNAGPVIFMLIYAIGTVFFLPGSVLTLAGGALFGPLLGTFYNLTAASLGAMISFLAARYLAHDWVEKKTGGRMKQLKQGVESEGWRFVAFVRLVPLFPFNLLNYALGLTRIKFSHYSITTFICMLPGAFAYTYLGYAGREAVAGGEGLIQKSMLALALLAVVAFLPRIISRLRQGPTMSLDELEQRLSNEGDLLLLDVRSADDYQGKLGHIEGSRNIPLEEIESRLSELPPNLDKTIALICTTDRRSKKVARLLGESGFSDVHVVAGGMVLWSQQQRVVSH